MASALALALTSTALASPTTNHSRTRIRTVAKRLQGANRDSFKEQIGTIPGAQSLLFSGLQPRRGRISARREPGPQTATRSAPRQQHPSARRATDPPGPASSSPRHYQQLC